MLLTASFFTSSVLSVRENVIKNIIFRASALFLQFTVYHFSSYIAFRSKAYTSFLMFAEGHIQRLFFVASRGWSRAATIVLIFAVLWPLAGLYDTLLWSLDSPGYVIRSSRVNGLAVQDQLLATPSYIVLVTDSAENASSIDVDAVVTGNLFKSGFNFTLPATTHLSMGEVVPARQSLAAAGGPRIWLDDEGLSVAIDSSASLPTGAHCNVKTTSDNNQAWSCSDADNGEWARVFSVVSGRPLIWWDGAQYEYLQPLRHENPWAVLGTGGDTAAMKHVFTVTKGARRHTFVESFLKISMASTYPHPIDNAEILDIVRRTLSNETADNIQPPTQKLADIIIATQANHTNFMGGTFFQNTDVIGSTIIELFTNITSFYDKSPTYSAFRVSTSSITLIRSETLSRSITPLSPCPGRYFSNFATGGQVRSTSCYLASDTQDPNARFLGQLDTSAFLILTDALGDGSTATSSVALSEQGLRWYQNHTDHMDQILTSRAVLLGGNRGSVLVDVQHTAAALSYLQLLLSCAPVLAALISFLLVRRDKRGYFQSSFLAAVHTAVDSDTEGRGRMGHNIRTLVEIGVDVADGHVRLVMSGGSVLANVGPDGVPLLAGKDDASIP